MVKFGIFARIGVIVDSCRNIFAWAAEAIKHFPIQDLENIIGSFAKGEQDKQSEQKVPENSLGHRDGVSDE